MAIPTSRSARIIHAAAAAAAAGLLALAFAGTATADAGAAERIPMAEVSHIHGIAVDPRDPSRLFLATHYGVFLTSADGMAERVSDNEHDYMGFTPHPGDPNVLYASGHPSGGGNMGFIVSRDGGASWQEVSPGADGPVDFHAMDVSRADPGVIYGLYGSIQVSRDGGETWVVATAPPADTFDLAASAVDADLVYAATRDGLMVSRDAAISWEPTGPAGQPASMVQVGPDGSVYAFVVGSGLMRAPGTALAWQPISNDFGPRILLHLAIDGSDAKRMFAVTQDGGIFASTDGGRTWGAFPS